MEEEVAKAIKEEKNLTTKLQLVALNHHLLKKREFDD